MANDFEPRRPNRIYKRE